MVGGRLLQSPYVGVAEFRHLYLEAGHTGQASKSTIAVIHDTIIGGMQKFFCTSSPIGQITWLAWMCFPATL